MKKILLFAVAVCFSVALFSQQSGPSISWEKVVHDFGTFNEDAGVQSYTFDFVNTGNEPLYITNVKPSCGCTGVDYSKEPIQPGGKGFVTAGYNPDKRPGKFNKSINVTTNEFQPTSVLRIMGEVTPRSNPEESQN
ncbi:MAG: DUF1573 domain-containing protein [Bacteroidales bacterium]|jgi:hypothetical protein|nr:DUF1573 domain-containing protein [Bacteroidales bacterium]